MPHCSQSIGSFFPEIDSAVCKLKVVVILSASLVFGLALDALSNFDSNGDGRIDAADTQWSQLKIWKDANSNGVADAGELIALDAVNGIGIRQINLENTPSSIDVGNGNVASAVGSFVWQDGHAGAAHSVASNLDLTYNPFYRDFTDTIPIPEALQGLPDMQGRGAVLGLMKAG